MGMEDVLGTVIMTGMTVKVMEKTGLMDGSNRKRRKNKKKEDSFLDW